MNRIARKVFLLALMTFSLSSSWSQQQYHISLKLEDGMRTGKAYLRYFSPNGPVMDSAEIAKGKCGLKGRLPSRLTTARLYLVERGSGFSGGRFVEVWLESGGTKIKIDRHQQVRYSGSPEQDQFTFLQQGLKNFFEKHWELDRAYDKSVEEKNESLKADLLENGYPTLFKEKQKILGAFIRKYPASRVSAYKFSDFAGDGEMALDIVGPVYDLLDPSIKQLPEVIQVARLIEINRLTIPGRPALAFTQSDTSGRKISLSDFLGKFVLLDFWAGWCVPCRAENPMLVKLYGKYKEKGLEIIGVSLDGERKRWTDAIREDKLTWPQVSDLNIFDNTVAVSYGITSIPQNILIDREGRILAKNLRGEQLGKKLEELLK